MNYMELELNLGEKTMFSLCTMILGTIVGWLFYDSCVLGTFIGFVLSTQDQMIVDYLKEKRNRELLAQFKDLLYSLSASISTGKSITQGLKESMQFWKDTYDDEDYIMMELRTMTTKMEKGNISEIILLDDFAKRTGLKDISDMVLVCKTCKKTGGNFAQAMQKCSDIIGDKISLERELQTIMIQKKFEGRIIAMAPFSLILLMRIMSFEYVLPLYETNIGRLVSTIALALIIAAWASIEKVNSIDV